MFLGEIPTRPEVLSPVNFQGNAGAQTITNICLKSLIPDTVILEGISDPNIESYCGADIILLLAKTRLEDAWSLVCIAAVCTAGFQTKVRVYFK